MLRRHPLCPECGYDVSGQITSRRMRCPECGTEFSEGEVRTERRPGDWTPGRGLRRAARMLALRSCLFVPAWGLFVGSAAPWLEAGAGIRAFTVMMILGFGVGMVFSYRVVECAGFVSGVVTALAAGACLVALATAVGIAAFVRPIEPLTASMAIGAPWLFAMIVIVKMTLVDG